MEEILSKNKKQKQKQTNKQLDTKEIWAQTCLSYKIQFEMIDDCLNNSCVRYLDHAFMIMMTSWWRIKC